MAQLVGTDEIESLRIELAEIGRSIRSSFQSHASSFQSSTAVKSEHDTYGNDENELQWDEVQRLPTMERITSALFDVYGDTGAGETNKGKRVVDVTKLGAQERSIFVQKLIKHIENDNLQLLQKLKRKIDK
jgi:hypothetical protein